MKAVLRVPVDRVPFIWSVLILVCFAAALCIDPFVARWAAHLPHAIVRMGYFISVFGVSTYMFVLASLTIAWALVARRGTRVAQGFEAWTLIAYRAMFLIVALVIPGLIVQVAKHVVGRARPRLLEQLGAYSLNPGSWPNSLASFPSGHTASAFAAAIAVGLILPRARIALLCMALVIAIARIVAGQHYPSDVLAGAALGMVTTLLLVRNLELRGMRLFPGETPEA